MEFLSRMQYGMNSAKQKALIIFGVAFLGSTAAFTSIYLPFYSDYAKINRERLPSQIAADSGGGSRGSMWTNLNKTRKNDD
jgi:hypothetical protein